MYCNPEQTDELYALIDALREQDATDAQLARLEELVSGDVALRQLYLRLMDIEVDLHWRYGVVQWNEKRGSMLELVDDSPGGKDRLQLDQHEIAVSHSALARPNAPPSSPGTMGFLHVAVDHALSQLWSTRSLAILIAGSLVIYFLGIMIYVSLRPAPAPDAENARQAVAKLSAAAGAVWEDPSFDPPVGTSLSRGKFKLAAGLAEIVCTSGARVVIQGPAEFELESPLRGFLRRGRIVATVPHEASGFAIRTPQAEIVDFGTQFGVEIDAAGAAVVQVLEGQVEVRPLEERVAKRTLRLSAGERTRVGASGPISKSFAADTNSFGQMVAAAAAMQPYAGSIPLGNLFDDSAKTPLAVAVASDVFQSTAAAGNLGVSSVRKNGPCYFQISPHVAFNFANLGWTDGTWASVTNGALWPPEGELPLVPIHTIEGSYRSEGGIGMASSAAVVFDLDQIRRAGNLGHQKLRFICDRAGINLSARGFQTEFHLVVLVSDKNDIIASYLNGQAAPLNDAASYWHSFAEPVAPPINSERPQVRFSVPLSADARFLTLAVASAGPEFADHAVWPGARLEIEP